MNKSALLVKSIMSVSIFTSAYTLAAAAKEPPHKVEASKESEDEHEHEENGRHEEEEESPDLSAVGEDKGILAIDNALGFKLSPGAWKTFGIKTVPMSSGSMTLPKKAIFFGLQERNVFRIRSGFFKRVDFKANSKNSSQFTITIPDLLPGDLIVVDGVGFLRIAELAASGGGAAHSH